MFPHLLASDFEEACTALRRKFEQHERMQNEWLSVEIVRRYDVQYLRITTSLPIPQSDISSTLDELQEDEIEEYDEETLPPSSSPETTAIVQYDIVLSSVYQVPALYFSIKDPQHRYPPTMETLYQHLIPRQFKSQTEGVGVIGGITITDHPVTNTPVFFIHPCQTADVMRASVSTQDVTPTEYLMLWIGALGGCVGLKVPLALVVDEVKILK